MRWTMLVATLGVTGVIAGVEPGVAAADVAEPTVPDASPPAPPAVPASPPPAPFVPVSPDCAPSLAPGLAPPGIAPLVDPPAVTETTSYRAQTLAADGISLGAALLGASLEGPNGRDTDASNALFTVALLGGAFATPIIHGLHGHGARAIGSYLLRSGAMGVGGIVGIETASCSPNEWFCGLDRLGPGMLVGFAVAAVIDAAVLTDETREVPVRSSASSTAWAPVLAPRPGGGTLGFAAAF